MQILVGTLGGILVVFLFFRGLTELGISLSGLNPVLRTRRKHWKNQCRNPIYQIDNPMEMTALLMVAAAKGGSDMHLEEKHEILRLFEDGFHLSSKDASALLISSAYLLGDGSELRNNLKQVMQKCLKNFTREQSRAALSMIDRVASLDRSGKELVVKIKECLRS